MSGEKGPWLRVGLAAVLRVVPWWALSLVAPAVPAGAAAPIIVHVGESIQAAIDSAQDGDLVLGGGRHLHRVAADHQGDHADRRMGRGLRALRPGHDPAGRGHRAGDLDHRTSQRQRPGGHHLFQYLPGRRDRPRRLQPRRYVGDVRTGRPERPGRRSPPSAGRGRRRRPTAAASIAAAQQRVEAAQAAGLYPEDGGAYRAQAARLAEAAALLAAEPAQSAPQPLTLSKVPADLGAGEYDCGGAIYSRGAGLFLSLIDLSSNVASRTGPGFGGGLCVVDAPPDSVEVWSSSFTSNTAGAAAGSQGFGGAMFLWNAGGYMKDLNLVSNLASQSGPGYGGAAFIGSDRGDTVTLVSGEITQNAATRAASTPGFGGSIAVWDAGLSLSDSIVRNNVAAEQGAGQGGALFMKGAPAGSSVLQNNQFLNNAASRGAGAPGFGGAVYITSTQPSAVQVVSCTISSNQAGAAGSGEGGGLYAAGAPGLLLRGNTLRGNVAAGAGTMGNGGGLAVVASPNVRLDTNSLTSEHGHRHLCGKRRGLLRRRRLPGGDGRGADRGERPAGATPGPCGAGGGRGHGRRRQQRRGDQVQRPGRERRHVAGHPDGQLHPPRVRRRRRSRARARDGQCHPGQSSELEHRRDRPGRGQPRCRYGGPVWGRPAGERRAGFHFAGNTAVGNVASTDFSGYGGGWPSRTSTALTVTENYVEGNVGSVTTAGLGGGLLVTPELGQLPGPRQHHRYNRGGAGGIKSSGGGLHVGTTNSFNARGEHDITVDANLFFHNQASDPVTDDESVGIGGGGIMFSMAGAVTVTNNVLAGNRAVWMADGVAFVDELHIPLGPVFMANNTFADSPTAIGVNWYCGEVNVVNTIVQDVEFVPVRFEKSDACSTRPAALTTCCATTRRILAVPATMTKDHIVTGSAHFVNRGRGRLPSHLHVGGARRGRPGRRPARAAVGRGRLPAPLLDAVEFSAHTSGTGRTGRCCTCRASLARGSEGRGNPNA